MLKFENYRKAFYFGVSVWTSEFVRGTCEKIMIWYLKNKYVSIMYNDDISIG